MTEPRPGGSSGRPPGRTADRWILAAILVLAFAFRLVAVLQYEANHPNADHPAIDEASYDRWAREIAGGDWIGKEVFFQEPLYPYALGTLYAVFGPHRIVARIAQCLLWVATAAVAGALAKRLFGRAAGILAALAIALYGPGMLFPAFLLKENLFIPLFALLALALVATRDEGRLRGPAWLAWLGIGVLAGLGALLRGNLLVLIPLLGLWPLARAWKRRHLLMPAARRAALFLVGCACVLLPVAVRNLAVGGEFLLTTSGLGTNLYGGNNLENPFGRASEFSFVRGIPEHEAGDWRREAERRLSRRLESGEVSAYWRDEALRSFRDHPKEHLAILWRKLRLSLGRYEVPDVHSLAWDVRYVPIARVGIGFGLFGTLGLTGLALFALHARWGRRTSLVTPLPAAFESVHAGAAAEVALLFLAYLGTIVLTVTSDRARLPLVPLLAPFAAWTLVWAARATWARSQDAILRLALAVFAGALAVHLPVLPRASIDDDLDERDHNLAVLFLREGRGGEARAIAERLVREHPASARSRILLAEIDLRGGKPAEEVLAQVAPLADEPSLNERERFRARSLAAWIQLGRGAFAEAERRFRQTLEFDGDSRELREGLARSLIGSIKGGVAAESRARAEEALAVLGPLRSETAAGTDPSGLEILTAQAEFLRGRSILEEAPADERERELAQQSVQAALDRLRPIVESEAIAPEIRRRARLAAGGIQLWRRNWKPAENHFRAALALGEDPQANLGLVQALLGTLEDSHGGDDRVARLEEARRILEGLPPEAAAEPEVEGLRQRLDGLR